MSLEKYSQILYKELPNERGAFVEGGVLVYPRMFGLALPSEPTEQDMYRYLTRYSKSMDYLASATSKLNGKDRIRFLARAIEVEEDAFKRDSELLFMLESVLAGKLLQANTETFKTIFEKQAQRARQILIDIQPSMDLKVVDLAQRGDAKITELIDIGSRDTNPKVVTFKEVENTAMVNPANIMPIALPEVVPSEIPETNTQQMMIQPTNQEDPKEESFLNKVTSVVTPPRLFGALAIGMGIYFFYPRKNSNQGYVE